MRRVEDLNKEIGNIKQKNQSWRPQYLRLKICKEINSRIEEAEEQDQQPGGQSNKNNKTEQIKGKRLREKWE